MKKHIENTSEIFTLNLTDIQPSQLYISSSKLAKIQQSFNFTTTGTITPVPVMKLGDDIIYIDGHTRAMALWLNGETQVRAFWESDEISLKAYEICVSWCKTEGIYRISDLKNRIIPPDEYEKLWIRRCQAMHKELEGDVRRTRSMT